MNKSLLVFGVGLIVGAGGMRLFDIYRKDHSDDTRSDGQSQSNDGQAFDSSWSELDRERISEFLQNDEYTESDESNDDVRSEDTAMETGNVIVVDEELRHVGTVGDIEHPTSSFIDINDPLEDLIEIDGGEISSGVVSIGEHEVNQYAPNVEYEDSENIVKAITAIDFVKAVTTGKEMISFVYDRLDSQLCWNFTNVPVKESEIDKYLTRSVWDTMVFQLNLNGAGETLPLYFHDETNDVYIKIE